MWPRVCRQRRLWQWEEMLLSSHKGGPNSLLRLVGSGQYCSQTGEILRCTPVFQERHWNQLKIICTVDILWHDFEQLQTDQISIDLLREGRTTRYEEATDQVLESFSVKRSWQTARESPSLEWAETTRAQRGSYLRDRGQNIPEDGRQIKGIPSVHDCAWPWQEGHQHGEAVNREITPWWGNERWKWISTLNNQLLCSL